MDAAEQMRYGRAMIPKVVNRNFDHEAWPRLSEICHDIDTHGRAKHGLYLKDNSYFTWSEYGATWVSCRPTDIIGDFLIPERKMDEEYDEHGHQEGAKSKEEIIAELAAGTGLAGLKLRADDDYEHRQMQKEMQEFNKPKDDRKLVFVSPGLKSTDDR